VRDGATLTNARNVTPPLQTTTQGSTAEQGPISQELGTDQHTSRDTPTKSTLTLVVEREPLPHPCQHPPPLRSAPPAAHRDLPASGQRGAQITPSLRGHPSTPPAHTPDRQQRMSNWRMEQSHPNTTAPVRLYHDTSLRPDERHKPDASCSRAGTSINATSCAGTTSHQLTQSTD